MQAPRSLFVSSLASAVTKTLIRNATVISATENKEDHADLKSWKEIPGPSSLPVIGQLKHFMPGGIFSDLLKFQEKMYNMYGPLVRMDPVFGRPLTLFLYDPEECAFILRSENWLPERPGMEALDYYRRYHNKTKEESERPVGLMTDRGDNWRYFRTKTNPILVMPRTIKLYSSTVSKVAEDMVTRIKNNRDEHNMIKGKFNTEMNLWSLESIGVVAFGGRLNCLDPNLAENSEAKKLIRCVHRIFTVANDLELKANIWRYFPTKTFREAMKLFEEQEKLAKFFIDKARKEMIINKAPDDEKGILEKLLEIDERVAITMACDMLIAGVDTIANMTIGALYLLAANQDKQNKLRQELTSVDSRKYLKSCLKEAMRIMPVVMANIRKTSKEYDLFGYKIPKGTVVLFNHQCMSNLESQFPRPKEYIPERWLEDGPLSHKNAHPFAFSPFGFGARMCIGRRIGELEMETFLEKIILNFKVEWFGPPPKVEIRSLNYVVGPYNFIFKDI